MRKLRERSSSLSSVRRVVLTPLFDWRYTQFEAEVFDYDGRFYFPGLKAGSYGIQIQDQNFDEVATLPTIEIGGDTEQDLVVTRDPGDSVPR